jgi:hypothetical protein
MSKSGLYAVKFATLFAAAAAVVCGDTINFENQCPSGQTASGPCSSLFSTVGNAQTLTIPTSIGSVVISGGALFNNITNLPSDETTLYGSAGNASGIGVYPGSGFTNPITITFPTPITSFSLDILNGNTMSVEYQLADNLGNVADFQIAPNFSGGLQTSGFAAAGNVITISAVSGQSTPSGITWDFLIDNIDFSTAQTTATPEVATALLLGSGLILMGLLGRSGKARKRVTGKRKKGVVGLLLAVASAASAATTSPVVTLTCPESTGATGVAYSSSLAATGGVPPYTFSITTGALPGGLTLNTSSGAITGTPLASGAFGFTGKAVDSLVAGAGGSPDSTSTQCSITIAGAPVITNLNPYTAVAGGAGLTLTVDGTGFTPTSVVSWNGAALPTTYISTTELTVPISSTLITTPEFVTVTVSNSGLMSNDATFSVLEPWVQILDQNAVTFGQLTPSGSNLVADWQIGMAFADFAELSKNGYTGGFIQVLEFDSTNPDDAGAWVVQNLPIEGPHVLPGNGRPFTFAAQVPGLLPGTNAAVYHTMLAAAPPKKPAPGGNQPPANGWQPVRPPHAGPQFFFLRPVPSTIGGIYPPPITNPPAPADVMPVDPAMSRTDSQDSLTDMNSVEQQRNECAPASVANSMQYLGVNDGANNNPAGRPGSRVALLDVLMGYNINLGTSPLAILTGKARYIAGANLTGRPLPITMNSQGRFCPNASIAPNCPLGQNGDSGAVPTADFITDALKAKKDVEVCFAWAAYPASAGPPPTPASPGGAHCVFVTGYRFVNGFLTLDCTQDLNQGKAGGTDFEDGGHISIRVGIVNNQLWIRSFFGRPALITNVITEALK